MVEVDLSYIKCYFTKIQYFGVIFGKLKKIVLNKKLFWTYFLKWYIFTVKPSYTIPLGHLGTLPFGVSLSYHMV